MIRALLRTRDDFIDGGANMARSPINLALPVDAAIRTTFRVGLIRLASKAKLLQHAPAEGYRCLRIAGEMLLVCPFLRFSKATLTKLLREIRVDHVYPIGNRGILLAEFLPEKAIMRSRYGFFARPALRVTGLPFLDTELKSQREDCAYAIAHLVLAWKRELRAAH